MFGVLELEGFTLQLLHQHRVFEFESIVLLHQIFVQTLELLFIVLLPFKLQLQSACLIFELEQLVSLLLTLFESGFETLHLVLFLLLLNS